MKKGGDEHNSFSMEVAHGFDFCDHVLSPELALGLPQCNAEGVVADAALLTRFSELLQSLGS
jgi:hypothetical protein